MSLTPSAKIEVRRKRYKVAVDAEEGRRRREDNLVEICMNKLESLPSMVAGVYSNDNNMQLEATTLFGKLLSIGIYNAPVTLMRKFNQTLPTQPLFFIIKLTVLINDVAMTNFQPMFLCLNEDSDLCFCVMGHYFKERSFKLL